VPKGDIGVNDFSVVRCPACGTRNRVPAGRTGDDPRCARCKGHLFDGRPMVVTDSNFAENVERAPLPVLVDFWAPWCGPCRSMEGPLANLARERAGSLTVAKINVDENPALSRRFGIRSIPALKLFQEGSVLAELAGAVAPGTLSQFVDQHLQSH